MTLILLSSCSKTVKYKRDSQKIRPYKFSGVIILNDSLIEASNDELNIKNNLMKAMKLKWDKIGLDVKIVKDFEEVNKTKDSDVFILMVGSISSNEGQDSGEFTQLKTIRNGRGKNYSTNDVAESINWQKNTKNINTSFHFLEISDETNLVASSNVVSRFSNLKTSGNQGTTNNFKRTEYEMKDDSKVGEVLGNINAALKGSFLNVLSSSKSATEEISVAYVEVEFINLDDAINKISNHHTKNFIR